MSNTPLIPIDKDDEEELVEYRRIPVASLFVPHDYQREYKPRWVETRIDKFSRRRLGTLTVAAAGNGKYSVVDGQHRLALIRAAQNAGVAKVPTSVWCEIRQERSRENEADLFLGRNDAQPVHPIDKFRARVIAADPIANQIKDILRIHGVQIGYPTASKDSTNYGCITVIETVFATGQLNEVIKIVEESWAQTFGKAARTQFTVSAVALFHNTYRELPEYSVDRAIKQFSKVEKFSALMAQAKNNATTNGTQVQYQLALLLLPRYNSNLKTRLPLEKLIEAY